MALPPVTPITRAPPARAVPAAAPCGSSQQAPGAPGLIHPPGRITTGASHERLYAGREGRRAP